MKGLLFIATGLVWLYLGFNAKKQGKLHRNFMTIGVALIFLGFAVALLGLISN